jgi:glycosyltransferase involved in cell wall biosynthesis
MKEIMQATSAMSLMSAGLRPVAAEVWPRISLVTPAFNSGKYIEQTIRSVLAQNYPNLDYFIVDGGSTDGTMEVIRKYEGQIAGWISEPDKGMYDALNKGFARSSGEIMGWISATDQLQPGGLLAVSSIFRDLPEVEWITGRPTRLDEEGKTIEVDPVPRWSRIRFLAGFNRYIQQESTFWRRSLWEKAGGYVDASRRMASDFELWVRFFRHARLYPVDALIGGFRMHAASLGLQQLEECHRIHDEILAAEWKRTPWGRALRSFHTFNAKIMKRIPGVRYAWWRLIEQPLYTMPGPDRPPVISYQNGKWKL